MLKKIKYNDDDLSDLTRYRPELVESHDGFFKVIDKMNDPRKIKKRLLEEVSIFCSLLRNRILSFL